MPHRLLRLPPNRARMIRLVGVQPVACRGRLQAELQHPTSDPPTPDRRPLFMLAQLRTYSLLGIEAVPVDVEVDVSPGALPKTVLVGLPEAAVKESVHRIERAMVNSGFQRPQDRIVINLAPP